jgi:hypothetical protein
VHASTFSQTKKFLNIGDLVALIQFEEQKYQCHDHILKFSFLFQPFPSTKFLFLFQPFPSTKFLFLFNHFLQQSSCSYSTISFNKVLVLIQPFPSTKFLFLFQPFPSTKFLFLFNHFLQQSSCSYSTISFNKVLILIQPFPSTFIKVKSPLCPRLRVLLVWDS